MAHLTIRFVPELNGVLIQYDSIKSVQKVSKILNESPFTSFYIRGNFTVFSPKSLLVGSVNSLSKDRIGLLVFGVFNATISIDQLPPQAEWSETNEKWTLGSKTVSLGTVIIFAVSELVYTNEILTIIGTMKESHQNIGVVDSKHLIEDHPMNPPTVEEVDSSNEPQVEQVIIVSTDNSPVKEVTATEIPAVEAEIPALEPKQKVKSKKKHKEKDSMQTKDKKLTESSKSLEIKQDDQPKKKKRKIK